MGRMIELTCPKCGEELTLDAGFAGGICRCEACTSLVLVPRRQSQAAEVVRPAAPDGVAAAGDDEGEWVVDEVLDLDEDGDGVPAAGVGASGEQTYVTESGRSVVAKPTRIPTAKRKRARRVAASGVVLVTVVVLGGLAAALYFGLQAIERMNQEEAPPATAEELAAVFPYDAGADPTAMTKPNALGLSVRDRCVVLVVATEAEGQGLALVQRALERGLSRSGSVARVNVAYRLDGETVWLGKGFEAVDSVSAEGVRELHERAGSGGDGDLVAAWRDVLAAEPDAVVWVQLPRPDAADVDTVVAMLAGADPENEMRVDAMMVGNPGMLSVESKLSDRPGEVNGLSSIQMEAWAFPE